MDNELMNFLNLSKESTDFLTSQLDSDIGEMVYSINKKGLYIMDIAVDINHYTMQPVSRKSFIKEMMARAIDTLNKASEDYYNGIESMSNIEFDRLYDGLKKVEEESRIILENSPTQKVGSKDTSKGLKDIIHEYPAKSLDKTKDINEYRAAFEKVVFYGADNLLWIMPKMDGITGVATYEGGKLVLLATRGNGEVGKDITDKAPYIKGLPLNIDYKDKLVVRGEMVMSYSEFERINQTMEDISQYKNPRNLASGTINQPECEDIKEREITFFAFNLVYIEDEQYCSASYDAGGMIEKSFGGRLRCLSDLGINTVTRWSTTPDTLESVVNSASEQLLNGDYPVDGLVAAMDDIRFCADLPGTGHHPHRAKGFAFKWTDETAETVLRDIEWSASRTGLLNPVAVFDSVELCGTTVSRASLHNLSYISDMCLRIGDRLSVYKANMIIPQIAENLDAGNIRYCTNCHNRLTDDDIDWEPDGDCSCRFCKSKISKTKIINSYLTIDKCPVCGGSIGIEETEGGTFNVRCTNPFCVAKQIGKIVHFAERDCMDVKGLSEKKVEFLVNNGYISGIYDLLNFSYMPFGIQSLDKKKFLCDEDGWDKKSETNLWDAIDKALDTDFVSFIHAMGIPNIGKGQAKELKKYLDANYDKLAEEYNLYGGLYSASTDTDYDLMGLLTVMVAGDFDFTQINGFGNVIAESLYTWVEVNLVDPIRQYLDYDDPACEVIEILKMLRFHDVKPISSVNEAIKGKTFVITGSLEHYKNRDELIGVIESLGGKVSGSVSKNTDYLINNDIESQSSKNKKARELGVKIISEIEFKEAFIS